MKDFLEIRRTWQTATKQETSIITRFLSFLYVFTTCFMLIAVFISNVLYMYYLVFLIGQFLFPNFGNFILFVLLATSFIYTAGIKIHHLIQEKKTSCKEEEKEEEEEEEKSLLQNIGR